MLKLLKEKNIINDNGINPKYKFILKQHPDVHAKLIEKTIFLHENSTDRERLYCILNNIKKRQICKNSKCNNPVNFILNGKKRNTYHNFCSLKCSNSDILTKEKKKETCLINYNVPNPSQSDKVKTKKIKTSKKKYNCEYPWQNDDVKQNKQKKLQEKYNVDNVMQLLSVKQKNLKSKIKSSWFIDKTNQPHYKLLSDKQWLIQQHHEYNKNTKVIATELNVSPTLVQNWLHRHNIEIKHYYFSEGEQQLGEYIKTFNLTVYQNIRTVIPPYELDIYLPQTNIAFEYNGDYWHGNNFPETQYKDEIKKKLCENKGIKLVHVWESEWLHNNENTRNYIQEILSTGADFTF